MLKKLRRRNFREEGSKWVFKKTMKETENLEHESKEIFYEE
jgi:hypothetical protein